MHRSSFTVSPLRLAAALLTTASLALIPACSHPNEEVSTAAAEPAPDSEPAAAVVTPKDEAKPEEPKADEPAPAEAEAKTQEMSFVPDDLSAKGDNLEHCLDCRRKASTYTYCVFDKADLAAAVGPDNMAKEVTVKVTMVEQSTENHVPDDPSASQPDGGFNHVKYSCTVDALITAG